jgi:hypothetical protein
VKLNQKGRNDSGVRTQDSVKNKARRTEVKHKCMQSKNNIVYLDDFINWFFINEIGLIFLKSARAL